MASSLSIANLFGVSGKIAVVTGGARGIGLMITAGLVENGATVYITGRGAKDCEETAKKLTEKGPGKCIAIPMDLSTEKGCVAFVSEVAARENHVDILVNNSGTSWGAPLSEFPDIGWDKVFNLNLKAPFTLTRAFLPLLEKSVALSGRPAKVIMIGSIAGLATQLAPTYSYDPLKAALHTLTRKLANDLASRKITVNAIAPGFVPSKMSAQLETYASKDAIIRTIPLRRVGAPGDMAGVTLYLAGPAGDWVTGIVIPVDGGVIAQPPPFTSQL